MIDRAKFKARRIELGLSQGGLADRADVSQQLIVEIEAGRTRTSKAIYRFATALLMPAHELDDDIPVLDDELEQTMVQIKKLPKAQEDFVRRGIDDLLRIAQRQTK